MNPEQYRTIKRIFLEALDRAPSARAEYVRQASAGDPIVQNEVNQLLRHHVQSPGASEDQPAQPDSAHAASPAAPARVTSDPDATQEQLEDPQSPRASAPQPAQPADKNAPRDRSMASVVPPPEPRGGPGSSRSRIRVDHGRFAPGTMIAGRFRVIELAARGGMGEVYRAEDLKIGETVALKFLPRGLSQDREWLERLLDEVRVARNVAHPNVCRVYDVDEAGGDHFLSMEYVDGETMSALLGRIGRFPPKKAAELAQQLCAGLAAIHDQGILHRDLKPSNLMIDERGVLKVTDFGLAVGGEVRGMRAAAGTPGYVAPESIAGRESTVRSDIYALGLVLYELFTGVPAYRAGPGENLLRLQSTQDPSAPSLINPEIRPNVERAIMACLERDPAERPQSVRKVARMLPGGENLPATESEASQGETATPAPRPGIVSPVIAALLFAATVVCGLGFLWLSPRATLLPLSRLEKPPEVLAEKAREILHSLRYEQRGLHEAWAFDVYQEFLAETEKNDQTPARWSRLGRERPSPVDFWFRLSPKPLATHKPTGVISMEDPPANVPGMISLRLTPLGKLRELNVVDADTYWPASLREPEPQSPEVGPPTPLVDYAPLFLAAGLDQRQFRAVEPKRIPPVFADERRAWEGVYPESPDEPIRIEAASSQRRVVAFRAVETRYPKAQVVGADISADRYKTLRQSAVLIAMFAVLCASAWLARRNLLARRGDRATAWKLAGVGAGLSLAGSLCRADTLASQGLFVGNLWWMFASSALSGLALWLVYVAVEPYARRIWPESLMSWTRLLHGRWNDPHVGVSLSLGAILGCFTAGLVLVQQRLPAMLGQPPVQPFVDADNALLALNSPGDALAGVLLSVQRGLALAFGLLACACILRIVVKRSAGALALLAIGLAIVLCVRPPGTPATFPIALIIAAAWALTLVRAGVLTIAAAGTCASLLLVMPITTRTDAWYFTSSAAAIGLVVLIAAAGSFFAAAGKEKPAV